MQFLILTIASSLSHAALPIDSEHWIPLQRSGAAVVDAAEDDVTDELDIVGDSEHPAGHWTLDEDNLYVRIRIAASPESPSITGALTGSMTENGWGLLINSDEDPAQYEYLVSLDQMGISLRIESDPEASDWTANPTTSISEFVSPLSSSMVMTSPAESTLGGGSNHFIDISLPRSSVDLATTSDTVRLALVTDLIRLTRGFEYDIAAIGTSITLADALSDPIGIDSDEDGLSISEERAAGTDPTKQDTDGDGYSDGDELLLYDTDPLDGEDPDPHIDDDCDAIPDEIEPDAIDLTTDPDGDGLTSEEEIACDSDPCLTDMDIDDDGVDNVDEERCGGDPCIAETDIDGDGVSSVDERLAGTDPCVSDIASDTGDTPDTGGTADTAVPEDTGETPPDTGDSGGGSDGGSEEDIDCDGILDHEDDNVDFDENEDNDGDGISNGVEINECSTDPCSYDADPDRDMVSNTRENQCGTHPCSPDTDADGIWDNEELNPEDCGPDSDGDGIVDALDPADPAAEDPVLPESGAYGFVDGNFTGGGCSHAPGRSTLAWSILALMLFFRRHTKGILICAFFMMPHTSAAQSFDSSSFTPTSYSKGFIGLRDPVPTSAAPFAGLFVQHAKNPLIYRIEDPKRDDIRVLGRLWSVHVASGYQFERWDLAIHVPLHVYAQGDLFQKWGARGDMALESGVTVLQRTKRQPGVGLSGQLSAPTGDETNWLGSNGFVGTTNVDFTIGTKTILATQLGTRFEKTQFLGELQTGTQFRWRTGAHTPIVDKLAGTLELFGAHQVKSLAQPGANSIELLGSGQYALTERTHMYLGAGSAVSRGIGAPALRLLAGIRYGPATKAERKTVKDTERSDTAIIHLSVTNHEDQAMQARAILVEAAEAIDTSEAGLSTSEISAGRHTLRINQPGYAPIQRILDLAPGTSVTLAVVLSPSRVEVSDNKILIQDRIFFETGSATIAPSSFSLLDEVAMVMLDDPTLLLVEVQGHTDDVGNADANLRLSQERADSVKQYLEKAGVNASRLQSKGFGETKPLSIDNTDEARTQNRRVEFHVVERGIP